jgi:circadian clock protein KaiB
MRRAELKLYVSGNTVLCELALRNLKRICEEGYGGDYQLTIIDVLEHSELAEQDKIVATPTLIKVFPPPSSRLIGDFSDSEIVRRCLGV